MEFSLCRQSRCYRALFFFFYYEIYIFAKFQSVIKHYSQVFIGLDNVNTYALNDCWCVSTVLQSDTHHFL